MNDIPKDPIGGAWLARHFGVQTASLMPVASQVGGRRTSQIRPSSRLETYIEAMRPAMDPASHLQFHLRHETPHLELLSRVFHKSGPEFVQAWIDAEPTGQYARRAAFFYEWLTGGELRLPERLGGNYVDAIDADQLVAASPGQVVKIQRWRVNDNLPGSPAFCPMVLKTEAMQASAELDISRHLAELTNEFGEELVMKAAVWMTLRESKSSFAIEGEANEVDRVKRFADVMGRRTGKGDIPFDDATLGDLQREILGGRTSIGRFGIRKSPVFIGESHGYEQIVHYVAPNESELEGMLAGLRTFLDRTAGQSPVMRCAVASFGFVYIHPLADGNGRMHRFLVNDILRRDGVINDPVILPVSAVITDDQSERRRYDEILDSVSRPLMDAVRERVHFSQTQTIYPDGVVSNLVFDAHDEAKPVWRYPDLGPHVEFMSQLLLRTLTEQMREESRYLQRHGRMRSAIKEVVEMPNHQVDRVIRSIRQNHGELTNLLAKELPVLKEPGVWEEILEAVRSLDAGDDLRVAERRGG